MRRFGQIVAATAPSCAVVPRRTFFGKGWDNAAVEVVYRGIFRRPHIAERLRDGACRYGDSRSLDRMRSLGDHAAKQGRLITIFLQPGLGDPHRVLKAYSLTAYPILDESGNQVQLEAGEHHVPTFADPDDDYSKVVIPNLELVELLAQELLKTLRWEVSPRGAASLLESLYRGSEIPDTVFETPKILDKIENIKL